MIPLYHIISQALCRCEASRNCVSVTWMTFWLPELHNTGPLPTPPDSLCTDLGPEFSTLESRSFCGGARIPRDNQSQYVDQGLTRRKPFRFRGGSPGITMTNSYKPMPGLQVQLEEPYPRNGCKFLRKVSLVTCRPLGARPHRCPAVLYV